VGIDKFMSECRAFTNVVGNGVATIVVSRWEKELEGKKMTDLRRIMANNPAAVSETKPEERNPVAATTS
jgi:aerobic C4-dicarboxylate transport protein